LANASYIRGRWDLRGLRRRPQAILWSDNSGTIENGIVVPEGQEYDDFLVLSDHNRTELQFSKQRIENRKRMINGTMRSYHIADKLQVSWSWDLLPSRPFNKNPVIDPNTGKPTAPGVEDYTVDKGAGGVDLLDWYERHPGSFYMFLAYDKYNEFEEPGKYESLSQYNQILEVNFVQFDYDVVRRGGRTHDLWNITVTVEEI
jgi:hypothetical protein